MKPTPMPPRPDAAPAPFPAFLDLAGAPVLVVGGGDAAVAKCRLLLPAGAAVRVVDPAPERALEDLAEEGRVALLRRAFAPADLDCVRFCCVALEEAGEAAGVVAEARRRGVLVNAVDRPPLRDFATPALVRDLRARTKAALPLALAALAALCARRRARAARALPDRDRRRRVRDDVIAGEEALATLERGDAAAAPPWSAPARAIRTC